MTTLRALLSSLRPGLPLRADESQGLVLQSALSTVGMLAQGLVRWLYTLLISWGFGVAAVVILGRVNTSISVALFGSMLIPLAAANAVSRELGRLRAAQDPESMRAVLSHLARLSWAAAGVIGLGAAAYAHWVIHAQPLVSLLTGMLALSYSAYTFTRGTLLGLGLLTRATAWDLLSSIVAVAGVAALVVAQLEEWLLAPLALGYAIYALGNTGPLSGAPLTADHRRSIRRFVLVWLVQSVATGGFLQGSQMAANYWGTPATTGYFAYALSLATPASLVSRSLQTVLFPRMAKAHGSGDHALLARQTDLATRWLVLLSITVYGPLMLCAPTVLLIYGRKASAAVSILVVLLAACLVQNVVTAPADNLMSREEHHNRRVRDSSVLGALVGAIVWLVLAPRLGVPGVAWGYLVGTSIAALVPTFIVWRLDALPWLGLMCRFLGAAAASTGVALWIAQTRQPVVVQGVATAIFLVAWLATNRQDLLALIRSRRHQ